MKGSLGPHALDAYIISDAHTHIHRHMEALLGAAEVADQGLQSHATNMFSISESN